MPSTSFTLSQGHSLQRLQPVSHLVRATAFKFNQFHTESGPQLSTPSTSFTIIQGHSLQVQPVSHLVRATAFTSSTSFTLRHGHSHQRLHTKQRKQDALRSTQTRVEKVLDLSNRGTFLRSARKPVDRGIELDNSL